jgi:hypothetical protein
MPRGRFTKRHIIVNCSICNKEIPLTEGEYNWKEKRNSSGRFYCSVECKNKGISSADTRDIRLICENCKIDFTDKLNKYAYRKRVKFLHKTGKAYCSVKCRNAMMNPDPEHIKKVADKQRGISVPSRTKNRIGSHYSEETRHKISISKTGILTGRKGYKMTQEVKLKIRLAKIGKPTTRQNWDTVHQELKRKGVSIYAITRAPIPDAIWVEDGKPVALELENKRVFFEVKEKMKQYEEADLTYHKFDKVYLVWYLPNGVRMNEWVYKNGVWKEVY